MDGHATTPTDPRVVEAMLPYFGDRPGNASSPHVFGWEANEAIERAKDQLGSLVGADPKGIVFTSGATESNNLALFGAMEQYAERGRHLVTTTIEHASVLEVAGALERRGGEVTRVGVDADGFVDPQNVLAALRDDTVVCSVMWANNEVGTIQAVEEVAAGCRERGVLVHCDATQAVGRIPVSMVDTGIDLLSLSAHKFHGPKGVGALILKRRKPRVRLAPQSFGGGQQDGLRPGTMPTPLIAGLGEAAALAGTDMESDARRIAGLRDRLQQRLTEGLPDVVVNGGPDRRLPGNLNVSFVGVEAQAILLELHGIGVSIGSACATNYHEPSHVLLAMGLDEERAHAALRLGLSRFNTESEVDAVADAVLDVAKRLRAESPIHRAMKPTSQD